MARFGFWSDDLENALAEPFPSDWVKSKKQGGSAISYVPWHRYVSRLNTLVGSGWSMGTPIWMHVGDKLCMGLPITILGVTRVNFGDEDDSEWEEVTNQKTGEVEDKKTMYGSPVTNAFAQAFKRTCALFGLGLYLYDKGAPVSGDSPRSTGNVPQADPLDAVAPGKKNNGKTWRQLLGTEEGRGFISWALKNMTTMAPGLRGDLEDALRQPIGSPTDAVLLQDLLHKAQNVHAVTDEQAARVEKTIGEGDADAMRIAKDWLEGQIEKRRLGSVV